LGVSARKDTGTNVNTRLAGYVTANLSLNYIPKRGQRVSFRIENLTGARYEETYGYFAPCATAMVGFEQVF
jgi:outer membrane cobalamin receptor